MDIYEALKKDHDEIQILLDELVLLQKDDDYRFVVLEQIKSVLVPHFRAEEQVFYNTLRAIAPEKEILKHNHREHLEAEAFLRSLQLMNNMDNKWKPLAEKFKNAIEDHVQKEEGEIFLEAKKNLSTDEARIMGETFEKIRPQIGKEGMLQTTFDMMVSMLPPRISEGLRHLGDS